MKNVSGHTGILTIVKKLKHSTMGNPRYQVRIDGYTASTVPNSTLGYRITNYDGKYVSCHIGTHRGVVSIECVTRVSAP
jgi:hypothetical protein